MAAHTTKQFWKRTGTIRKGSIIRFKWKFMLNEPWEVLEGKVDQYPTPSQLFVYSPSRNKERRRYEITEAQIIERIKY